MKKIILSISCLMFFAFVMYSNSIVPVYAKNAAGEKAEFVNRNEINEVSKKLGKMAKKLSKDLNSNKIIATINGEEILYKEFALKKLMCDVILETPKSNSEIFSLVVKDKVRAQMAKELNIYPSNSEVTALSNDLRSKLEKADNPEVVHLFIEAYGITEDQYWSEWSKPFDTIYLIDFNLGKYFASQVNTPEVLDDSYYEEIEQIFNMEVDNKLRSAIIEIKDNSLGLK